MPVPQLEVTAHSEPLVYPDSDGLPMAENTVQFACIVKIKENLDVLLPDFVAGDLFWYPVQGDPGTRLAPDVMVALGRPKGHRGSYMQWLEGGVPPAVVFEVLSPGNTFPEMQRKFRFYERHGVEEYYVYDPSERYLMVWLRTDGRLLEVPQADGFVSPRLGIRFELGDDLEIYRPDGTRFQSFSELAARAAQADQRAAQADQRAEQADQRAEQERQRAEALRARLLALGVDPDA